MARYYHVREQVVGPRQLAGPPAAPRAHTGSVWDWHRLRYNYFRVPGQNSVGGWQPLTGLGAENRGGASQGIGIDIERALPLLPPGSKYVGYGTQAVGRIYRASRAATAARPVQATVRGAQPQMQGVGAVPLVAKAVKAHLPEGFAKELTAVATTGTFIAGYLFGRMMGQHKNAGMLAGVAAVGVLAYNTGAADGLKIGSRLQALTEQAKSQLPPEVAALLPGAPGVPTSPAAPAAGAQPPTTTPQG